LNFEVPYLKYDKIKSVAAKFLDEHWPSGEIPVDIERIVEIGLHLRIAPFPELFREIKLNAFLTADRSTIFVDQVQYDSYAEKYRFSIAHEVGHYILHSQYYDHLPFTDTVSYKKWRLNADPEMVSRFEVQGNLFAELILMPDAQLLRVCKQVVKDRADELRGLGTDVWPYLAKDVAPEFEVSPQAASIRIQNGNIPGRVPLPT